MRKYLATSLLLLLLLVGGKVQAQKVMVGLPLWDIASGNACLEASYQLNNTLGLELQGGYGLGRKYRYQGNLSANNRGPFAGIGLNSRFKSQADKGHWMLHLRLLFVSSKQDVQADIPNYYGNIQHPLDWQDEFWLGQVEFGHAWTLGHFQIDPSLRLSIGPSGGPEQFHAYLPMVGRLHTFATRYGDRPSFSALPGLHLGYWF
jgi:hypothetical protein